MRDGTRHEGRDVRPFARKLDNRPDHNFRLVGRRKADEPAMRGSMGVLGRARLAGDRQGTGVAGGGARRSPLDHGDHRTA